MDLLDSINNRCVVDNNLSDEVHITVIATGLNDDEYPKYIEYETNKKYNMKNINTNTNEEEIKEAEIDKVDNLDNNKSISSFGDDLDVPTFLRNRNS